MTNYLLTAGGQLPGGYPWSVHAVAVSSNSESAVETAWDTGWGLVFNDATLKTFFNTLTELTFTSTSTADATFHQTTVTTLNNTHAGSSASEALPYQAASIVSLRTAQRTRWGRGRWYLPSPAANALATTGPVLSTAYTAELVAALHNANATWTASFTLQILHRKGTKSGPGPNTLTPVISMDVSNKLAVQRRRGDKFLPVRTNVT